jgi:LPS O-antigen subunit length determinant protein (WzzB/FepE family)
MTKNQIETSASDDEISLFDIYEFFLKNVRKIAIGVLMALLVGVVVAFSLPVKYEASAAIESSRIATITNDPIAKILSFKSTSVESKEVLAEKLKSPTYFAPQTLKACGFEGKTNPGLLLSQALVTSIPRNSNFVSISFKVSSPELAKTCLEATLINIIDDQTKLGAPLLSNIQVALQTSTQQFDAAKNEQKQLLVLNRERLALAKQKLSTDQAFVAQFSKDALSFKFENSQFSASALLLSTLITKQNEIKELELEINKLQSKVDANITALDNEVLVLNKQVSDIRNAMTQPLTQIASFATPIYAPDDRVEPKRLVIVVISAFAGFALTVMLLLMQSALIRVRAQRKNMASP